VGTLITALDILYEKGLKISKAVIKVSKQFVLTVYEKSLKIAKAVIKVPTQFVVVTVYGKSLKISKAVINVPTQFVVTVWIASNSSHIQSPQETVWEP
jgi:hypothetical protein